MKSWQRKASGSLAFVLLSFFVAGCSSQSTPTQSQAALATNTPPQLVNAEAADDMAPLARLAPVPPNTSTGLAEVAKLVQSGMDESVILAYIDRSPTAFEPTVDEILYLNDLGVSAKVISALIRHGEIVREASSMAATNTIAEPMAVNQPPATATPAVSPYTAQPAGVDAAAAQAMAEPTQAAAANEPPFALPPQVSVFYNDLAPYGNWVELDGYGWCWQPTSVVVNPTWRPYADQGRWLYTDCGWYWQSDYSWGWAPFHYGRWLSHSRCGWVWVPDTVWGPSWVTWRQTPSYCGWAPLPPSCQYVPYYGFSFGGHWVDNDCDFGLTVSLFSFVHWRHFNDHNPHGYCVPRNQTAAIYSHSKVVNNYATGSNNAIINDGVNWDRLAAYRPTKLRPISVRELSPEAGTQLKPDRVQKSGQSLVIYRPRLQTATPPAVTLQGPRTPDFPGTGAPMTPPGGQALAAPSRTSDLVAGRPGPPRSSSESPGATQPSLSQPLAAPNTVSRTSPPRITSGRFSDSSSLSSIDTPPPANSTPPPAPPPSTAGRTPTQPMSSSSSGVTVPSRNESSRSSASSSSVPRMDTRTPTIASPQRTATSSPAKPSPSTYAPTPSQPSPAPYSSPTPNYSTPPRQPSYSPPAPSVSPPPRSAPTFTSPPPAPAPVFRSEPPARAPMSAPSVSRAPDPTPSRAPSPSPSPSSSSSRDTTKDTGTRK